ncbi:TIGR03986 family CRISPR-associated RAMP protein [Pauljensenia sp. UMB0018B]|uniref:TIGR03986 family CRISPR-associated RAMP protein n=2 Tax=Schaalia odontolytica TaxID=1660 RepID=A0A2I1HZJ0_9ACTO|nr:TIGR03986 family CRISPR-associated RAMP protein [Pauljensenia sp. UMB0018B]PKY64314.1 TIGR03986 family CRISPR-associated RAMP protein [Schaalia odontolytica]
MGNKKKYEKHAFHSSVNRIPRLPDYARKIDSTNNEAIYQEGIQTHLDHLHSDRLSGYFDLQVTAHSPLLIGQQTTEEDLHYLQVQELEGKPYIAPTMIKGLLSTSYERITSSRFRVFDTKTHNTRLTYRTQPNQAISLVPVRCTHAPNIDDTDGQYTFERLDGGGHNDNKPAFIPIQNSPALSETKKIGGKKIEIGKFEYNHNNGKRITKHFKNHEEVRFKAYRIKSRWIVSKISKLDGSFTLSLGTYKETSTHKETSPNDQQSKKSQKFEGYLYLTTPREMLQENKTNFGNKWGKKKWSEKIFIKPEQDLSQTSNNSTNSVVCSTSVAEAYIATLRSYRAIQDETDARNKRNGEELTRHNVYSSGGLDNDRITVGTLAYASMDTSDTILELIPISVGRHAYSHAPSTLAEADGVNPARTLKEASAADRLFGFVGNDNESSTSLRGRVQIGPVSTLDCSIAVPTDGQAYVTLPPLLSPKPSSGRRFLVPKENFPDPPRKNTRRDQLYDPDYSSLGEATYPTHRSCIGQPLDKIIEKFSTSGGDLKTNESLQLHVRSWIKQGSVFACRVHFEDISPKELAFLLWPLIPKNLSPEGCSEIGYHKLGIGKPLGLGLVEARIVTNSLHLEKTQDITSGYKELNNVLGTHYKEVDDPTLLQYSEIGDSSKLPCVRAFQRAAYGFEDTDVPVRYVSLEENKANNATNSDGSPKYFDNKKWLAGRSPQSLWIEDSATAPEVFLREVKTERSHKNAQKSGKEVHSSDKSRKNQGKHRKKDRRTDIDTQHNASTSIDTQRDKSGTRRHRKRGPRD